MTQTGAKKTLRLPDPRPTKTSGAFGGRILPIFLPFAGCPSRCVFCDQRAQAGVAADLASITADWETRIAGMSGAALAFYGGTFTSLPEPLFSRLLHAAADWKRSGRVVWLACSTRPDAIDEAILDRLVQAGFDRVELGVQSFDDAALALSGRGCAGDAAVRAARLVREAGIELGIQLMPGLPGGSAAIFSRDVEQTLALYPGVVRLYPCLVLRGTELARRWAAGDYTPLNETDAIALVGAATARFWAAGIRVIRAGVRETPGLAESVLAGPHDPGLGGRAFALAYWLWLEEMLSDCSLPVRSISAPARLQGMLFGKGGEFRDRAARLTKRILFVQCFDFEVKP